MRCSNSISLLLLHRLYSSSSPSSSSISPRKLKNICYRHRARAIQEARHALTEYLHSTRSLPFSLADHIASNSPFSLLTLLSLVPFPSSSSSSKSPDFPKILRQFLSYRPVNEFDFLSESIGLPPLSPIPSPSLFLSDHPSLLSLVSALSSFGFPRTKLGLLYSENPSLFSGNVKEVVSRLHSFEELGFRRVCVIGICLAFPWVLSREEEEMTGLILGDLRWVFEGIDGEEVHGVYGICRKVRAVYESGTEMGRAGELMGRKRWVFVEVREEVLRKKLSFFLAMGMEKEEVGPFILENDEILHVDWDSVGVSMPEYLMYAGLGKETICELCEKCPYAMGKNELWNLPGILRAMELHEWFIDKLVNGNLHYLTDTTRYTSCIAKSCDKKIFEGQFLEDMERIKSKKKHEHVDNKLEFLFSIGFGKNKITSKAVSVINGTKDQLQARFDFLIQLGMEHSTLCRMISATPKLLNQSTESIQDKVNYLCHDLGYSLDYLNSFPAFLCFDLENRIKPRFNIMNWLKENGLLKKHFSPATILANAEKRFIINLYGIHPAAPKQWLEIFSSRSDHRGNQRNLFAYHP